MLKNKIKKIIKYILKKIFNIEEYNRFLYIHFLYPSLLFKKNFIHDQSTSFKSYLEKLKARQYKYALILGNAENLNELNADLLKKLGNNFLIIGLNRSIYNYQSDVLLWADLKAMQDIIKNKKLNSSTQFIKVTYDYSYLIKSAVQFWIKHKNLLQWPYQRLFLLRTILTSAFHLCSLLSIKKIYFIGVSLESRNYFYDSSLFKKDEPYEIQNSSTINDVFSGYDTKKIVKELIEHLIKDQGFSICSLHKNDYLQTIEGLTFSSINNLFELP